MKKLEVFLLQLTIFFIPVNLSLHYYSDQAYINGRLIDYLLPKLFLSDIPIIILIMILIYNYLITIDISSLLKFIKNKLASIRGISIAILIAYLLLISLVSPIPISSLWFTFKLIEFIAFGLYLTHNYTLNTFQKTITKPLLAALILQVSVSIYQYINQSSLFEYIYLGESSLKAIDVVKSSTRGYLEVIPYGTTPHPNVLAGFLSFASIYLLLRSTKLRNKITKLSVQVSLISLIILTFLITNSYSALSGTIISLIVYKYYKLISIRKSRLIFLMYIIITPILIVIFLQLNHRYSLVTDNSSFTNRYELNTAAFKIIQINPVSGVGPNLFTTHLSKYPTPGQQSYLLQPVHNGLLLILSEIGYIGFCLVLINLVVWLNTTTLSKAPKTSFIYLYMIVTILLLDHYPLTLQTGQLLLTFSLIIPSLSTSLPE